MSTETILKTLEAKKQQMLSGIEETRLGALEDAKNEAKQELEEIKKKDQQLLKDDVKREAEFQLSKKYLDFLTKKTFYIHLLLNIGYLIGE